MPKLPDVQSLGARPTPASAYRPQAVSGAELVPQAMTKLGQTVTAEAEDLYKKNSLAETQNAITELDAYASDLLYNPDTGAVNQKGEKAASALEQAKAAYNRRVAELQGKLGGNESRMAFTSAAQARALSLGETLNKHVLQQQAVVQDTAFKTNLASSTDNLARAYRLGNASEIKLYTASMYDTASAYYNLQGTPDAIPEAIRTAKSNALASAMIGAAQDDNIPYLRKLMKDADADLTEDDRAKVSSATASVLKADDALRLKSGTYTPEPEEVKPDGTRVVPITASNKNILKAIAQLESSGGKNAADSSAGAFGKYQFMGATAKQYGITRYSTPEAQENAANALLEDNRASLRKSLGREPTPQELYLAHQQGATGAVKLIRNPEAKATIVVGENAVLQNGGKADMTAKDFVGLWDAKFQKAYGAAVPLSPEAPRVQYAPEDIKAMDAETYRRYLSESGAPPATQAAAYSSWLADREAEDKVNKIETETLVNNLERLLNENGNDRTRISILGTPENKAWMLLREKSEKLANSYLPTPDAANNFDPADYVALDSQIANWKQGDRGPNIFDETLHLTPQQRKELGVKLNEKMANPDSGFTPEVKSVRDAAFGAYYTKKNTSWNQEANKQADAMAQYQFNQAFDREYRAALKKDPNADPQPIADKLLLKAREVVFKDGLFGGSVKPEEAKAVFEQTPNATVLLDPIPLKPYAEDASGKPIPQTWVKKNDDGSFALLSAAEVNDVVIATLKANNMLFTSDNVLKAYQALVDKGVLK